MPRQARIDSAGLLHHIIARGIEKQHLFREDADREQFLERLAKGLERSKARCYAWVLMGNHIHLLLRTGSRPISELMRSLLTGHAVYYNNKYNRSGHLFQNRYKSIICQQDVYFLELVRYIHLNPIRAGILTTLEELDSYAWSGHSAIVGNQPRVWQEIESVLERFGNGKQEARAGYRNYIREGFSMGARPDLQGGGLIRSAGSHDELERRRRDKEYHLGDERILGDSEFVEGLLAEAEEEAVRRQRLKRRGWTIERVVKKVAGYIGIEAKEIQRRGQTAAVSRGKGIVSWIAYNELGISGAEIAEFFRVSRSAVTQMRKRWGAEGERIYTTLLLKQHSTVPSGENQDVKRQKKFHKGGPLYSSGKLRKKPTDPGAE